MPEAGDTKRVEKNNEDDKYVQFNLKKHKKTIKFRCILPIRKRQ